MTPPFRIPTDEELDAQLTPELRELRRTLESKMAELNTKVLQAFKAGHQVVVLTRDGRELARIEQRTDGFWSSVAYRGPSATE